MKKDLFILLLAALLLVGCDPDSAVADNTQAILDAIGEYQADIDALQADLDSANARIIALEAEVGDASNAYANSRIDANEEVGLTNAGSIAGNATSIADNAADIAANAAAIAANAADIADNAADIADNAADIADNAADIADNAADIADNAADISTIEGRMGGVASAAWAPQVALLIDADLTLQVPGTAPDGASLPSIGAALGWLDRYDIGSATTVTIAVTGAVTEPDEISLRHRDGDRIVLADADGLAELQFTGPNGVLVPQGRSGGVIDGVDLTGGGSTGPEFGVQVRDGGALAFSSPVTVSNFANHGVWVQTNGTLDADASSAINNGGVGWTVSRGGSLRCWGCTATGNTSHGFQAARNGYLDASQAVASGNSASGLTVTQGGAANCESCTIDSNGSDGLAAIAGTVWAVGASADLNSAAGFSSRDGGILNVEGGDSEGNAIGFEARGHSYIRFNSGTATNNSSAGLSLDTGSTAWANGVTFTTPGGTSAVDWGDNSFYYGSNNSYVGPGGSTITGPALGTTTDGSYAR